MRLLTGRVSRAAGVALSLIVLIFSSGAAYAATAPAMSTPNGLSLAELKMTGSEILVITNNSSAGIALGSYWLQYFNNFNPLASGVSSDSQVLPSVTLGANESLILAADSVPTCGAAWFGHLSLSLSDTSGYVQIALSASGSSGLSLTPVDHVSWSSSSSAAADIKPVPSNTVAPNAVWYRTNSAPSTWTWQRADQTGSCDLSVTVAGTPQITTQTLGQSPSSPPSIIVDEAVADSAVSGPSLPSIDVGLNAPQISELLPNPAEPQSDDEDEFIELYNPNDTVFDLSGFSFQTGITTKRTYKFPSGTMLEPKSFTAFFSVDTGLALSNTKSQAFLIDPFGAVISQTDAYASAKDGQAWALGNGVWSWTTKPTPGVTNLMAAPVVVKPKSTKATTAKTASVVKSSGSKTPSSTNAAETVADDNQTAAEPGSLHPAVIAGVGTLAVGYGLYEYRTDLFNRFNGLRKYRETRRSAGK